MNGSPSLLALVCYTETLPVNLPLKELYGIAGQLGAQVLTRRKRDLEDYRAGLVPVGEELKGKRVACCIDAGKSRLRRVTRNNSKPARLAHAINRTTVTEKKRVRMSGRACATVDSCRGSTSGWMRRLDSAGGKLRMISRAAPAASC